MKSSSMFLHYFNKNHSALLEKISFKISFFWQKKPLPWQPLTSADGYKDHIGTFVASLVQIALLVTEKMSFNQ